MILKKLNETNWELVQKLFLVEKQLYGINQINLSAEESLEEWYKKFLSSKDVFEILSDDQTIGGTATSVKNFENTINVLKIEWIFIFPNNLNEEVIIKLVNSLKYFYRDLHIDKVEFYLNPNIMEDQEKTFDRAGLTSCEQINTTHEKFPFGNNVQITPKAQIWTEILGGIMDILANLGH